jgi:hypothetical protein
MKLEKFKSAKFALPTIEMISANGGATPGHHKFLWMTWHTYIEHDLINYTQSVCRTSDPKKLN